MHLILLAAFAATALARPSFIAVPADQIAFVDLTSLHLRRTPRQTLEPPPPSNQALYQNYQPIEYPPQKAYQADEAYQPIPIQIQQLSPQQQIALAPPPKPAPVRLIQNPDISGAASQFDARPPDFGEYVDFGAHTGDNGAFGWYADYPVNNHEDSYRK